MNREAIERPFPSALIKQRPGPGGRTFSYVEGAEYIRRLNEAFDGRWTFEVLEHQILKTEVIVLAKLSADGVSKTAFGGSSIAMAREGSQPISIADDLKSAATDALKKASSLLGLGLHLYSDPSPQPGMRPLSRPQQHQRNYYDPAPPTPPPPAQPPLGSSDPGPSDPGPMYPGDKEISEKQLGAIMAIGRSLGWSTDELREWSVHEFGDPPPQLNRALASSAIGRLQSLINQSK